MAQYHTKDIQSALHRDRMRKLYIQMNSIHAQKQLKVHLRQIIELELSRNVEVIF